MDESTCSNTTDNSYYSKETVTTSETENAVIERNSRLIVSISAILQEIITENRQNIKDSNIPRDNFFSTRVPTMTIEEYLKRIIKYSQMEASSLIMAIIYIDRVCDKKKYVLCQNNIHKLLMASSLLSIKFNEDNCYKNGYYAKIGGITLEEMNRLEYDFFVMLDFRLFVDEFFYQKYDLYFSHYMKSTPEEC